MERTAGLISHEIGVLEAKQSTEGLAPADLGHLNALAQSLTRVERSLRQWRELRRREAAELDEAQITELLPRALASLGLPDDLVREVMGHISS